MGEPVRNLLADFNEAEMTFVAIGQAAEERCDRIHVIFQAVCAMERDELNRDPRRRKHNIREIIRQVRKHEITLEEFLWVGPLSDEEIVRLPWLGGTNIDNNELQQTFSLLARSAPVAVGHRGDIVSREGGPESGNFHFCRLVWKGRAVGSDEADEFLKSVVAQ